MQEIKGELGRLNIVKASVPPKLIYGFNAISPHQIVASHFMNIDKLILKFIWGGKNHRITNSSLEKKNKVGKLMLPGSPFTIELQ